MSLYHWMGSPGPSPHCWACVQLQSLAEPDKVIVALVADSCEACEFAHVDLEQAAYYALGGTVGSGVVTVAWCGPFLSSCVERAHGPARSPRVFVPPVGPGRMFIDCPDGHSQSAVAALDSSAYKAVDLS